MKDSLGNDQQRHDKEACGRDNIQIESIARQETALTSHSVPQAIIDAIPLFISGKIEIPFTEGVTESLHVWQGWSLLRA